MNGFALIVFFSFLVSLGLGVHVLFLDRQSVQNRVFFALNMSFAIWSFAVVFFITAPDAAGCLVWDLIASIGYYSFASFVLHFFLVFTGKTGFLHKWWAYVILYAPAVILIAAKVTADPFINGYIRGSNGWMTDIRTESLWFLASVVQYILYCLIGFALCLVKWRQAQSARERKQARIILISGLSAFVIGSASYFMSALWDIDMPDITVVGLILWSAGILYGIQKYKLLVINPKTAAEDILETIMDSVILVDSRGTILHANIGTADLLGHDPDELAGTDLDILFPEDSRVKTDQLMDLLQQGPVRNLQVEFLTSHSLRVPVMVSASECIDNDDDLLGYVIVSKDITKLRDMEKQLKHLAHHDVLTNLPNRLLLNDRLAQAIARAERNKTFFAVALLDLDLFKQVNDVLGHNIGDLLLVEIAKRLTETVRQSDTVVRLGGDEFVILIDALRRPEHYEKVVQKVLERVARPCVIQSHKINVSASIGISIYPTDGHDMESLMKNADLAMYYAKNHGRNQFQSFSTSMSLNAIERVRLEGGLSEALANQELLLLYQPVIDIETENIIGVEALVQWNHPEQGVIAAAKFMQTAEESGLIIPIGEWVLESACRQAGRWQAEGHPDLQLSVNLSLRQFQQKNLCEFILDTLDKTGMAAENLLLEITESTVMSDIDHAIDTITNLYAHEIRFIIDDFGAGYSSLLYFRKLPLYAVKLDRFFTTDIADDPESAAIVSAVIAMAHNMKLKVIAAGIENDRQFEQLCSLDQLLIGSPVCDGAQGHLFSEPVAVAEMESLLLQPSWKQDMF
ncbi:MAG: EAL domain-containing protein [Bacillota bacterium]|nr:EAL domain-containing protein [Bacillota bacterium]